MQRRFSGESTVFETNGAGTIGRQQAKNSTPLPIYLQKLTQN